MTTPETTAQDSPGSAPTTVYDVAIVGAGYVGVPLAQVFADWLVSPQGQAAIASYRVHGESLFRPSVVTQ